VPVQRADAHAGTAGDVVETAFLAEQVAERRVIIRLHATRLYGDIIEPAPPA
jgi:hypothetical protein